MDTASSWLLDFEMFAASPSENISFLGRTAECVEPREARLRISQ